MFTYEFFQSYWWFVVSLLASLLVFLLFVQGDLLLPPWLRSAGRFLLPSLCFTVPVSAGLTGFGC